MINITSHHIYGLKSVLSEKRKAKCGIKLMDIFITKGKEKKQQINYFLIDDEMKFMSLDETFNNKEKSQELLLSGDDKKKTKRKWMYDKILNNSSCERFLYEIS